MTPPSRDASPPRFRRLARAVVATVTCLPAGSAMAQAPPDHLPAEVQSVIGTAYGSTEEGTRYVDGSADLNGDGKPELLVYVVGGKACGTGGCPTLVFTPEASGYRLVSTVGLTRPPIRASTRRTRGWRNLIVHVSGGGATPADVELASDGKSYPDNPTVRGPRVTVATGADAQVVIKDFPSLESAKPLPKAASSTGPSFDCVKATGAVEKRICADPKLARLDRTLAEAYATAMSQWPDEAKASERAAQRAWIASRNACGKARDVGACVEARYQRRLAEVQIRGGQLEAPIPVGYVCKGHEDTPFSVSFYNQTDPKSAVITFGNRQAVALAAPSGSGARYTAPDLEFWEHHGEATLKWSGATYTCAAR